MQLAFAPRISHRLLDAIARLDDSRLPIAEVNRRVGREAWRLGLPKPSYQRVRELVHALRRLRHRRPSTTDVLLDVAFHRRGPMELLDLLVRDVRPLPP